MLSCIEILNLLKPPIGLEPITCALRKRCSAIELEWPGICKLLVNKRLRPESAASASSRNNFAAISSGFRTGSDAEVADSGNLG